MTGIDSGGEFWNVKVGNHLWAGEMSREELFSPGRTGDVIPEGDVARQAVRCIGGYAYQAVISTHAWLDLDGESRLLLEIAEDYAVMARKAIRVVQVKDTRGSGTVTLNSPGVIKAVAAFVDLVEGNPDVSVQLRFLTTSGIGLERAEVDRPAGLSGLEYWRDVAAGAECGPLRKILESEKFPECVREFCRARDDAALRRELIRKIDWDCGAGDFDTARSDLEDRLIVLGRDKFGLSASEARRLVDPLVYRVLEKSTANAAQDRVLTRADLYTAIDSATRISLPRAAVDELSRHAGELSEALGGGQGAEMPFSSTGPSWLLDGASLPILEGMIARKDLEGVAGTALDNFKSVVLVGGGGLGKSILARTVVSAQVEGFFVVDFRDTTSSEARDRLNMLYARVGALPSSALILEDLNCLDDANVALAVSRVLDALRQRYRRVLITCYRRPSVETLTRLGVSQGCIVDCLYFSELEAAELVRLYGGDSEKWGRRAYLAGASGHPQLTHAFVTGMATRGWPAEEIEDVILRGLSSDDTVAARDTARRNLVSALPEGTRNLLYRLSIVAGRFDRALALSIGGLEPAVRQCGECMDQLIGPWIEAVGNGEYRVSPLASGFGREMLGAKEQKRVHGSIALHASKKREIDALDVNAIMVHGLAGESTASLAMLTRGLLRLDVESLENLAESVPTIRALRTDRLIYPKHVSVSVLLRVVQFRLAAALKKRKEIVEIVAALFREVSSMPDGEPKEMLDQMVLSLILSTKGVANHLDNWVDLLLQFKSMVEGDSFLQSLAASVESSSDASGVPQMAMMFSIGIAELDSVRRLEELVKDLDKLDVVERSRWLTPIDRSVADYSVLINSPWVAEQSRVDFDASDVKLRYRRMAEITSSWDTRALCIQCWVAQAIMHDEYQEDPEGALKVLDEGVKVMGDDLIFRRARAKVYWRCGDHPTALGILRSIADDVGRDSPVERVTTLREAAISAANCGEWSQAEQWFIEAQSAAKLMQSDDRQAVVIGLGVDSAVAAFENGDVARMLERLAEAVVALADVDPEQTLRTAYCHRVVRHTVLWAQSQITKEDVEVHGAPIVMRPGTCSNPEPLPEIRSLPLGHIDVAHYMLAQAEVAAGVDVGIRAGLEDRLVLGPIPVMEMSLRVDVLRAAIDRLDAVGFSRHFLAYLEARAFFSDEVSHLKKTFDAFTPERGKIPGLKMNGTYGASVEGLANQAILSFLVRCIADSRMDAIRELENALKGQFSGRFPGTGVFDQASGEHSILGELDRVVRAVVFRLIDGKHFAPNELWMGGLRLFEWANQSIFQSILIQNLASWQRASWTQVVASERFRLFMPRKTVPEIRSVLEIETDDSRFLAKLLLATESAVQVSLGREYRNMLTRISLGASSSPSKE